MNSGNSAGGLRDLPSIVLGFEGLRGVLALSVCLGHYGINALLRPLDLYLNFDLAVDVFFALSGFVLSHTGYFGQRSRSDFVVRRFARLYPLHLLALLLVLGVYVAHAWPIRAPFVVQNLLLLQNVGLPPQQMSFNFPGWSISVEFWISILFVGLLFGRPRFLLVALPLLVVLTILIFPGFQLLKSENVAGMLNGAVNGGLLRGIAGFCVGITAYLFCRHVALDYAPSSWASYAFSVLLLLIFLKDWHSPADSWLLYACIFGLLITIACGPEASLLTTRVPVFLGSISYSVYLLHIPLILILGALFSADALRGTHKLAALLILFPLAAIVHRYIERPAQRLILQRLRGALSG